MATANNCRFQAALRDDQRPPLLGLALSASLRPQNPETIWGENIGFRWGTGCDKFLASGQKRSGKSFRYAKVASSAVRKSFPKIQKLFACRFWFKPAGHSGGKLPPFRLKPAGIPNKTCQNQESAGMIYATMSA